MRKLVFFATLAILLLGSCKAYKNVPYLKNSDTVDLSGHKALFDARIMPKDEFNIIVKNPVDDDAVRMFNLHMYGGVSGEGTSNSTQALSQGSSVYRYTVTNEGNIDFPILGKIHCAGMTRNELENYIADRIQGEYTKDRPIVIVTFTNFHVTVLGEVGSPGLVTSSNGKLNIFEALAQSGDLTISGRRDNIKIIREFADGEKKIFEVNVNDAGIIKSDLYQLQQNDIVYVTPTKAKARGAGINADLGTWMSSTSMLMSVTSWILAFLRK